MFSIKRFDCEYVRANTHVLFNSNNHGARPADYNDSLLATTTRKWIKLFISKFRTMVISSPSDLYWMKKYREELTDLSAQLNEKFQRVLQEMEAEDRGVFVRTEHVSLKNSQHGTGPYKDFKKILESLVSSTQGHECILQTDEECVIYLMPWVEINKDFEFRIFVHQNKITAISHQFLFNVNRTLASMSDTEIEEKVLMPIVNAFESIKNHFSGNYCLDAAILDNGSVYFIEMNPFGKAYAAGSALFHWLNDEVQLYSDGSNIEIRFNDHDSYHTFLWNIVFSNKIEISLKSSFPPLNVTISN